MKKRVVVAMSGGVDSSVAACLLKRQGYEVIGMTMCFNLPDATRRKPSCCGMQGIEDARRIAHLLDIRHYVVSMQRELKRYVIADFLREYAAGRTPNPCVRCNRFVKFSALLRKARSLDADYLATGHYVRIEAQRLKKAKDPEKDQSYFLYSLRPAQLRHLLFPLGEYRKTEVRSLARRYGLPVADKPGSQEICFLPQDDYRSFLKTYGRIKETPGDIVDTGGVVLGRHKGLAFYTVGQRQGLGLAWRHPLYVIALSRRENRVVVGPRAQAYRKRFVVDEAYFATGTGKKKIEAVVKIRYNHSGERALIIPRGAGCLVEFRRPQFAITPGQSAVFYQRRTVLGGGVISEVL